MNAPLRSKSVIIADLCPALSATFSSFIDVKLLLFNTLWADFVAFRDLLMELPGYR